MENSDKGKHRQERTISEEIEKEECKFVWKILVNKTKSEI